MRPERRAFLVAKLGEERTKRIEEQLAAFGKELDDAGVAFKDILEEELIMGDKDLLGGGAQTFTEAEPAATMELFGVLVNNVLASGVTSAERVGKLRDLVAELLNRLSGSDNELKSYLEGVSDTFSADLAASGAEKAVGALRGRVQSVLDGQGQRRGAASSMMMLLAEKSIARRPLTAIWKILGLVGDDVGRHMLRTDGKGFGTTRTRVQQMVSHGSKEDEARVLAAIKRAAIAAGRTGEEVDALADSLLPSRSKELGGGGINPYLALAMKGKQVGQHESEQAPGRHPYLTMVPKGGIGQD